MHKTKSRTTSPSAVPKQPGKRQEDKQNKKKVKFTTAPSSGKIQDTSKQVNIVQLKDPLASSDSENEASEMTLPDETSVSLDGSGRPKYFDLLSSSSDEYNSGGNSDEDE